MLLSPQSSLWLLNTKDMMLKGSNIEPFSVANKRTHHLIAMFAKESYISLYFSNIFSFNPRK